MGTQGPGRRRMPNREKLTAEDDALNQIAREAEARLAAKRAARAEAREIRMKELERQQKEEDSERYARHSRRHASMSDDEERMSVGSRGSQGEPDPLIVDQSSLTLLLHLSSRGAESPHTRNFLSVTQPSDYGGFLGSGSRASSRASSARASPVVEERPERDFLDKGSRTASTLSAATLASLGGASSRRGSCDTSFSVETEASIREMKDSLAEAEEKYRKAMVSNAQLHNEKSTLMYQVETLREELSDLEELLWETRRHCDDQTKAYERERERHSVLQFQFKEMSETLRKTEELLTEVTTLRSQTGIYSRELLDLQEALQWKEKKIGALERQREISEIVRIERDRLRDEVVRLQGLLKNHGVFVSLDVTTNGEAGQDEAEDDVSAESGPQLACAPHSDRQSVLELRLKKLFEERESLQDQVRLLKSQLGYGGQEGGGLENGMDPHLLDMQRDANRQISELKFKLVKSEQEVAAMEQNIIRLEGQVTRYKSASENAEKIEDELKVEKRKLQRELRSSLDRIEELEVSNSHLAKRLEKMKASRSALLAQQ
ncbi:LOW QUALITY PROTEIN: leucine-rich repeat flightless-interacting protein 2 [Aulostomus maculatus]